MSACPLHHRVDGPAKAPTLVLAGSLGATLAMWEPQLAALTERFRVVRLDHRGHGGSPAPPGPYTIADLAGDVVALLDDLGVATASFCGLSLGAMVAMQLAATAPQRVHRLALLCTSGGLEPRGWRDRAALVRAEGTRAVAAAVVGRWFTPEFAARDPALVERMVAMVASTAAEGYAGCCEAIAALDLLPALPRVAAPTLVVAGRDDRATPPEHGERIAAAIPGARLVVVPDAAHLASWERPDSVTALLLDHFTAGTGRSA